MSERPASCLAVIPARGGSKGFVGKNLADLCGKPLLAYTIDAGLSASRVQRTVVSSDSDEILAVAKDLGAEPLMRPARLASDDAPSEPVVTHCLDAILAEDGFVPDVAVLLQPTSPLRTAVDVDAVLALLERSGADAVISVFEPPHSPYKCFVEGTDGFLGGLVNDRAPFMRRQDLPRALMPNGAIYAVRTEVFRATGRLLPPRTLPFEMSVERSLDIDRSEDLSRAALFLGP